MSNHTSTDPWLTALYDPLANIKTNSQSLQFIDLYNDSDYKCVIADCDIINDIKRMKVYKGNELISQHELLDFPVALSVFYCDNSKIGNVAVAAGQHIFIYR